jgi:hypothetical protein
MSARRRVDALLLSRASEGLPPAGERELQRLLALTPGIDRDFYERAAAIVCLGTCDLSYRLPPALRDALAARATSVVGGLQSDYPSDTD